jgi:hypothetical protein
MLGILVSCAIEVIFTFTWSVYIALRCLSKRLLFEVPWFARVSELAARMRSDEATTLSTELGILCSGSACKAFRTRRRDGLTTTAAAAVAAGRCWSCLSVRC